MPARYNHPFSSRNVGYATHPSAVRWQDSKIPCQQVSRNGQRVLGIGRRLKFAFLFAPHTQLPADAFDPVNTHEDTLVGQVAL